MFKFNFQTEESSEVINDAPSSASGLVAEAVMELGLEQAAKRYDFQMFPITENLSLLKSTLGSQEAEELLQDADCSGSDLVPGKYEGGFKLWEGAMDLAQYLCLHQGQLVAAQDAPPGLAFRGQKVIELGCGHGIPGLVALSQGAEVHFQDYNPEVLREVTAPSVLANWQAWQTRGSPAAPAAQNPPARFLGGPWAALDSFLAAEGLAGSYDLVLTSETIYSLSSMPYLLACIDTALRSGGQALVAAKSYYFGVGGSSNAFKNAVEAKGGFSIRSLAVEGGGASIQREIIVLQKT
ncbi:hypothetical protein ACKKBF_B10815 [Auxenochlorella protothecoides x Auxenochlorella symbiontica]